MNIADMLSPTELAAIMHRAYFNDTAPQLLAYLDSTPTDDPSRSLRDRLLTALDFDIADLLHNANLTDLLPFAMHLDDADYDALAERMTNNDDFIAPLADFILADR
jgi:hypothetical protein